MARTLGGAQLPYSGVLSGSLKASGDTKGDAAKSLAAQANLSISPGRRGVPLSGKLNANYSGVSNSVVVQNSFLALPHSRLTLDGSLNSRMNVALASTDLQDFLAAAPSNSVPQIQLNGGQARFAGTVTGGLSNPAIAGRLEVNRFSIEGRGFDLLAADVAARSSGASLENGLISRTPMDARFSLKVGLRGWRALPQEPLNADVSVRGGDIADAIVLAGRKPEGYSGALTAEAHIQGTIGNPHGNADIQAVSGTLYGEPFDRAEVHVALADRMIAVPTAYVVSGPRRVDLAGEFQHPAESFASGKVHAHLKSSPIDLGTIRVVQRTRPNSGGVVQLEAEITGDVVRTGTEPAKQESQFVLTQVTADAAARNLMADGQNYGDATLSARTSGQTVAYDLTSNFAGSNSRITGKTQLVADYPTTADANISRLPIQRVLTLAKQGNIPARGELSGTAHFSGTITNPQGAADLTLANAVVYDEPLDRVHANLTYLQNALELKQLEVTEGPARMTASGRFDHPANDFESGNVQFAIESSRIDLGRIRNAQKIRPGLGGTLQINAKGSGALRAKDPKIEIRMLDADVQAAGLTVQKNNLGNLTLKANTSGNQIVFAIDSNLAGSAIQAEETFG